MSEPAAVPVLELLGIYKRYGLGTPVEQEVLHGISMALQPAEFVALRGPSGSGKSTLLNIIGLLESPTSGALSLAGHSIAELDDAQLTSLRGQAIGFVFQYHHLLPAFTALENVLMPLIIAHGVVQPEDEALGRELLASGGGALGLRIADPALEARWAAHEQGYEPAGIEPGPESLRSAVGLVWRSVVLWISLFAMLNAANWLGR